MWVKTRAGGVLYRSRHKSRIRDGEKMQPNLGDLADIILKSRGSFGSVDCRAAADSQGRA